MHRRIPRRADSADPARVRAQIDVAAADDHADTTAVPVRRRREHARVGVRGLRREANEQLKKLLKDKAVSEDEERRAQDDIQKLTDRYIVEVDKLLSAKEQEIMTI